MKLKKLKCCVIDDDFLICDLVQYFCVKVVEIDYCFVVGIVMDGLSLFSFQFFDLVFFDFNLLDMNGKFLFDCKFVGVLVVMIIFEKDFVIVFYDYFDIIDYIIKLVFFSQFYCVVERVLIQFDDKIVIKSQEVILQLMFVKDGIKYV